MGLIFSDDFNLGLTGPLFISQPGLVLGRRSYVQENGFSGISSSISSL